MSTIQIKRSLTSGNVPTTLADGELAINEADEILFYKNANGAIRWFTLPAAPVEALAALGMQINGSMEISQDNGATAVPLVNGASQYVVDQWKAGYNHTANTAVFSANQAVLNAAATLGNNLGFGLRLASTTALVSPNIGDYATMFQPVEGFRWERLNYGTVLARSITIGFWVFSTVTGTGSVAVRNSATNRSYVANFIVTAASTWQWVTVTIPGDQAGTWLSGNSIGAYLLFCFACGSTYQTPANTWVAGNFMGTSSNTNFFATNGNQVIVTGVVVLPGINLPPASRIGLLLRSSDEELRLCQRYLWKGGISDAGAIGNAFGATYVGSGFAFFPAQMRAAPTVSILGNWFLFNCSAPVLFLSSQNGFGLYALSQSTGLVEFYPNAGPGIKADARM